MRGAKLTHSYQVKCFNYAPSKFRILAHLPGGIPAALRANKLVVIMVPFFLLAMFIRCYKEAKHVDIIHANWSICGVIGGIVGALRSKPIITTIRGEDGNKSDTNFIYKLVLNLAVLLSSVVVGVSDDLIIKINKVSNKKNRKFICVPNGIDRELLNFEYTTRTWEDSDALKLISVGNITENKNFECILKAVNVLLIRKRNVTFTLIGDGPSKNSLHNMVRQFGISENVKILGAKPSEVVYKQVNEADIFILSSFREGRPNVLLESMAIGTPIIASDIEGVKEIIKDDYTGFLFDPNDAEQLVNCIDNLGMDHVLQNKVIKNARNFINENELFWDKTASMYLELYKSALTAS